MRFLLSVLLAALGHCLAGCSSPATPTAGTPRPNSSAPTPAAKTSGAEGEMPFPKLEKGMTADVIRHKLGQPVEIQSMPSPQGKAEVWIYNFEKSFGLVQVATDTRDVQAMTVGLNGPELTTVKKPVYSMLEKKAPVTLSLLMFNGLLEVQKVTIGEPAVHY